MATPSPTPTAVVRTPVDCPGAPNPAPRRYSLHPEEASDGRHRARLAEGLHGTVRHLAAGVAGPADAPAGVALPGGHEPQPGQPVPRRALRDGLGPARRRPGA